MLKIVHLGKYYFPDSGGIESVTLSLAEGAASKGHAVSVVCFGRALDDNEDVIGGVRVMRAPISKTIASQPIGWKYILLSVREARKSDVVHLHAPNMLAAVCSLFIGRKPRLLVHWHSDVINKGFLGWVLRPLEIAMLKRANCIVATSQVYADTSPALRPYKSKLNVVPIGVSDLVDDRPLDGGLSLLSADLAGRISGKKVVLAVGRLVPYKGFSVLVEAARFFDKDVLVVIVGDGPLREELGAVIDSSGLSGQVFLAGRLDNEALRALFRCASLYCMPSIERSEAFGVVLLEAMSYGLPVVASNIPGSGVPWVNQHGVSGLNVPVGDAAALADACAKILCSPEYRALLSSGARQRFAGEFTVQVSVSRMLAIYELLA